MECHPFGKSEYTNKNIPQLKKYYVDFLNLLEKEIQKGIAVTEILPTPTCIAKVENDVLISPNGDIYKCISGLDVPDFKICSYNELMSNELYYHERIATFSEKKFSSCINCKFLSLCNGGCFYEAALNGKEQACQKDLMEAQMPQLIKLRYLTEEIFKKPVFVTDYPKDIKAFYMRLNDDGKTVAATDCLVPGIGEIIGGSQREERLDVLKTRMAELDLNEEDYWWYLELRKYGETKHAGFGLGFERLIMYITGMSNIRDVIPFPRTTGQSDF